MNPLKKSKANFKRKVSRATKVPTTRSGRARKMKGMESRAILWIMGIGVVLYIILTSGCTEEVEEPPGEEALAGEYRVVKDEATPPYKRSVELIIPKRINEQEIARIAKAVKADDERDFERTFIGIRLKGDLDSDAYWATAHSNPDLKVRILGTTREDEGNASSVGDDYEQVAGSWLVDRGAISYTTVLYVKGNKLYMDQVFDDGGKLTRELIVSDVGGSGVRLEEEGNEFGEYYTVDNAGYLRLWSEEGNYYTSQDVKEPFNRELVEVVQSGQ